MYNNNIFVTFFLVIDPTLLSQAGGELLLSKLTNPVQQIKFQPGMHDDISPGALLVTDCRLADQLRDATIRAVQHGSYKRKGVLLLVDMETLVSKERLVEINLCPGPCGRPLQW